MAEDGYIGLGLDLDASVIEARHNERLAAEIPNWQPDPASLAGIVSALVAADVADLHTLATQMSEEALRYVGLLFGVTPLDPTRATVTSTWTMQDTAGYLIEADWQVEIDGLDGDPVGFRVVDDVTVPNGSSATAVGAVTLEAIEPGVEGSGLSGEVRLITSLGPFVTAAVTATGTVSINGTDGETGGEFLDRLSQRLRLQAPRVILPTDAELYVVTLFLEVARAVALNLYKPADNTYANPGYLTLAIVDALGEPCSSPVKAAVLAALQAQREVGFQMFVIDPTYTLIDLATTITALPGFDSTDVVARVLATLTDLASPVNYGLPGPALAGGEWLNRPTIRFQDVSTAINNVSGVDYWATLTIGARKAATIAASTDIVTSNAHGYVDTDPVIFRTLTGGAGLVVGTTYYVRDKTTDTFKVAATVGGAAIDVTTDATVATMVRPAASDLVLSGPVPMPRPGTITAALA